MARPDKTAAVAEIVEDFRSANATVLTEYRGLSVGLMKQLRRSLGTKNKYSVVKNTLTKIAAKEAGVELDPSLLARPSAVAFIKGDPIDAAKALTRSTMFMIVFQVLILVPGAKNPKSNVPTISEAQNAATIASSLMVKLLGCPIVPPFATAPGFIYSGML